MELFSYCSSLYLQVYGMTDFLKAFCYLSASALLNVSCSALYGLGITTTSYCSSRSLSYEINSVIHNVSNRCRFNEANRHRCYKGLGDAATLYYTSFLTYFCLVEIESVDVLTSELFLKRNYFLQ